MGGEYFADFYYGTLNSESDHKMMKRFKKTNYEDFDHFLDDNDLIRFRSSNMEKEYKLGFVIQSLKEDISSKKKFLKQFYNENELGILPGL